ncbi:type II toxin-antitoxin system RelE/ParE family toxin [Limnobacter sp.]|jgi:mRNA interferase RelE/StbE|uniref:type II toxin-antitoxin system RelE family toxin n=1 Tax=Limnobacter sp. TaxID=2003368 RepID=UPI0027B9ACFE|nr:type II toxin-antitoxin system RelE/ParE family toxin [Limnobacter sp.]
MANYKIVFKKSVVKDLRSISNPDVRRILSTIDQLAINPRGEGCKKLTGLELYRVRCGDYRIVYEIKNSELIVSVIKVGHRSGVYKTN